MHVRSATRTLVLIVLAAFAAACGGSSSSNDIAGAPGWKWVPFDDAFCTDMTSPGVFSTSTTGLAVSQGTSKDLVIFLQGGGACWDFVTCGGAASILASYGVHTPTASTGPFGPAQFAADIYAQYPNSWVHRDKMPAAVKDATVVFVPYCTGDVHTGDNVVTYTSAGLPVSLPSITWHHVGHANILAFLRWLGPRFALGPNDKLVVAGSSAGGFGSLANYPYFRSEWPEAKAYLVDDSGPPLQGDAIPVSLRDAWYASWKMGATLDSFCPSCQSDISLGLSYVLGTYQTDRVALLSHTQDATIRAFFGTYSYSLPSPGITPMPAATFETALRALGTQVMDPKTANGKYFFTAVPSPTDHPTLEDPSVVGTPNPGLAAWIQEMLSDSPDWISAAP